MTTHVVVALDNLTLRLDSDDPKGAAFSACPKASL